MRIRVRAPERSCPANCRSGRCPAPANSNDRYVSADCSACAYAGVPKALKRTRRMPSNQVRKASSLDTAIRLGKSGYGTGLRAARRKL